MVAYSFRRRFIEPILDRSKRQTIRADRKRHARPGEEMQLYTGMRTRSCKLIDRARCASVVPVRLRFSRFGETCTASELFEVDGQPLSPSAMEVFAREDGFHSVEDMAAFWFAEHGDKQATAIDFAGVLIRWAPLDGEGA